MIEGTEVIASRGVVAANPPEAARVGARILEAGGNAMDAASAASMACCMLQPHSTGIGGYVCCAVVLEGATGQIWSVDANSIAPAAAHERMYELVPMPKTGGGLNQKEYDCCVKDSANVHGPLAIGPPGMMAGMGIVWERWGKLSWPEIVAPSRKLCADGFPYASVAGAIRGLEDTIRKFPHTAAHLMPNGVVPGPEDIWHRPHMEKTLEHVAEAGWRDFYDGELGHKIADHIQESGGILTRQDMANYEPRVTAPYAITYNGATVSTPILTNGAITCLEILNLLECFDVPDEDTPEYWHLYAEILKLAWRDRLRYLADPEFADVPVERLLSKDHAWGRTERLRQFPGEVDQLVPTPQPVAPHGTLHVSTADADGNVVSMTISQGGAFGSCVTVPGTGIILGHGMCRLDPRPGHANSVGPGKRPLNNTGCMIVQLPDRDVAIGLPGGRRIKAVTARATHLVVDRDWTSHQAATAPRMHVGEAEPVEITKSAGQDVIEALESMGHNVKPLPGIAGVLNCAEFLRDEGTTRAGSSSPAAGADG
ncbi:MAG: hypothetical protein HN742_42420 [Lentisphaerae bacterium]|jgi:gamma-glutamyltranspeptidase / glutathione hydrolase|nr:hypothetical protein [Lentisphaerota bacterium]MBT5605412.1 hypothetical protein [Lentisphaerota bacterium]MBT7062036.1 hypothetical protein [Lentisphaerota bacterium]MBT7848594.1 hypothetical protein [Lentisphaerota bacterium]